MSIASIASIASNASTAFTLETRPISVQPHGPAQFASRFIESTMVLVTATGEIDACNARELAKFIERATDGRRRLIVDLRGLTFFGTSGFAALHYIDVACSRRNVNWVVLPGPEVPRILRICDPETGFEVASTLHEAITSVARPARSHLTPIPST